MSNPHDPAARVRAAYESATLAGARFLDDKGGEVVRHDAVEILEPHEGLRLHKAAYRRFRDREVAAGRWPMSAPLEAPLDPSQEYL
jgi:hypothetical protein